MQGSSSRRRTEKFTLLLIRVSTLFRIFTSPLEFHYTGSTEHFNETPTAPIITLFIITAIHICPFFLFAQLQNSTVRLTTTTPVSLSGLPQSVTGSPLITTLQASSKSDIFSTLPVSDPSVSWPCLCFPTAQDFTNLNFSNDSSQPENNSTFKLPHLTSNEFTSRICQIQSAQPFTNSEFDNLTRKSESFETFSSLCSLSRHSRTCQRSLPLWESFCQLLSTSFKHVSSYQIFLLLGRFTIGSGPLTNTFASPSDPPLQHIILLCITTSPLQQHLPRTQSRVAG
ncbi:hypothetical protein NA56DRAFT_709306 [Hyaloscypha hepaticicola]|uniref:Uncharacterized protein n=1 Tax=Hyaloscypha hepaticicola TaxID=2082293 RepID=A0A2J6PPU6_9HELO|nr:hypothetical protein NA56DRAFT_709306 [Hyaloscypha hepaticicola]